jgi:integrase
MNSSQRSKRRRSYTTGEKGTNRVRLFVHPRDRKLYLEYRDESNAKRRISLKHSDWSRGKQAADDLAAELRKSAGAGPHELTLRLLFDNYERAVTPLKSRGKQRHVRMARSLFERCWGGDTPVRELGADDWNRFIDERRSGHLTPAGPRGGASLEGRKQERRGRGVSDRQIQYDLAFARAAFNWAMTIGSAGPKSRLLDFDPFRGLKRPSEGQPCQPITTDEEYQALTIAAATMEPEIGLFLLLAHETGHRGVQLRRLRWSDFNSDVGTLRWRKPPTRLQDKKNFDHTTPLSPIAVDALREAQRRSGRIGEAAIFASFEELEDEAARQKALDWWARLERAAGLPRIKGRGWHSLRRNYATEFKHGAIPLVDVAASGGWKGTTTLQRRYMKPDEHTMRAMFDKRVPLRSVRS